MSGPPDYNPKSAGPTWMDMKELRLYVEKRTGRKPAVSAIYNWIHKGRKNTKLRRRPGVGKIETCKEWVDEFLTSVAADYE